MFIVINKRTTPIAYIRLSTQIEPRMSRQCCFYGVSLTATSSTLEATSPCRAPTMHIPRKRFTRTTLSCCRIRPKDNNE